VAVWATLWRGRGSIRALGGLETAMNAPLNALLCPMCLRVLKINTIEPHPTRDRVDVATYRCPIHADIWSVVLTELMGAETLRVE